MKKPDYEKEKRLNEKRSRKSLKRKKKKYVDLYFGRETIFSKQQRWSVDHDQKQIAEFNFELNTFLVEKGYPQEVKYGQSEIEIPKDFTLENNLDGVFKKIKEIRQTIMLFSNQNITLNFSKCKKVDFASLFLVRAILSEYIRELKRLDTRLMTLKTCPNFYVKISNNEDVNLQLLACEMIPITRVQKSVLLPTSRSLFHRGSKSQNKYSENRKGTVATKMRSYIEDCLKDHETLLTAQEKSDFDGIISEILNNAEDHSRFDTWYSFGNFFKTKNMENEEVIGEVNLAFMNFGYSIYDGILDTKDENIEQYNELEGLKNHVKQKDFFNSFSEENLFTLYSLQDNISRLRHTDKSRGTGTMTFIRSFMELGDYESKESGYIPRLLIFSGKTIVKCDNQYRPFKKGNRYFISLNQSESLGDLPQKSHLINSNQYFPGTLLIVKMYLNREHLHKKIENGTEKN
jgi:hypothetical protein